MSLSSSLVSPDRGVPISDILDARQSFGADCVTYEILMEADEPWRSLKVASDLSRIHGGLTQLRFSAGGSLLLRIRDNESAGLDAFAEALTQDSRVTIKRWTTVIGLDRSIPQRPPQR